MVTYQFEHSERLRCAFIGAGGHSYRNVYPSFQYAPVDLVAVCDTDGDRARDYARTFGAGRAHNDHREMLRAESPDAVFIVTGYTDDGDVQATALAEDALRAGAHVWMEKPTASNHPALDRLEAVAQETGRFVMTGLKKVFTPAMDKVTEILARPEFGEPSSISVRYPQSLPPMAERSDRRRMVGFLDHIYHPAAVLHHLMGPVERLSYEWEPRTGGSVTSLRFASGAVGTLHLTAGSAATSPLERVEVVGEGANVVVDNGVRLTYYRRGASLPYGRSGSYLVDDDTAPLRWEPEFSLGQLYNKNLFYLGYVPEIVHFCTSALTGTPPQKGTLADVREIMRLYEAYVRTEPGTVATIER
ncbi:Gfo/Idh/MocA family protein [Georgenia deserti]|uniref:Gfo/Idh/MocA family protein n=1 Tax=Georgenia deserti TaxID=2093781 RepID=A0ABW4L794_9MICO